MTDSECVAFLQWALPRLGLRWSGFRKVRRQVCKRIARRLRELVLSDTNAYRRYLEETPSEWPRLDACCRISISRFYRDRAVFDALGDVVLPTLALRTREQGGDALRAWSVGCAAGEEPYTLALLWELALRDDWPELRLEILATDSDEHQLERASRAVYPPSSLRGLPKAWLERAFEETPLGARLRESFRQGVRFELQDLRREMPDGPFDLVLCRNVAFTYFGAALQTRVGRQMACRLAEGGAVVIGSHEELPGGLPLGPWPSCPGIYRVVGSFGTDRASCFPQIPSRRDLACLSKIL